MPLTSNESCFDEIYHVRHEHLKIYFEVEVLKTKMESIYQNYAVLEHVICRFQKDLLCAYSYIVCAGII